MRILVTGGRGFIGRHVLEQLTNLGVDVTAIRRPACSGNYDYQ
ncbi:MAG: NAD-dependent epimerase/dehydratase family protein, partial [Bacteroidota bacterium]|nr:NAD-dependent epimerase/dehydratase family protein [Bacteroidota bacterium]